MMGDQWLEGHSLREREPWHGTVRVAFLFAVPADFLFVWTDVSQVKITTTVTSCGE